MKKVKKSKQIEYVLLLICFFFILFNVRQVYAKETLQVNKEEPSNHVMIAGKNAIGKEKAMESSETIAQFTEGEPLLVLGMTESNWYIVTYQEQVVYVQQAFLVAPENQEGLEEEFRQMNDEGSLIVEVVETYRSEAARSKIWAAIIVSLVIGIFLTAIISSMRSRKSLQLDQKGKKVEKEDSTAKDQLKLINLDKEELE